MMDDTGNLLANLHDLTGFLETEGSLDNNLQQLAVMAAKILHADNCSIMLMNEGEFKELSLRVCANFGEIPAKAYQESIKKGEGISGHVIASGKSLLIEDIENSDFAKWARRTHDPRKSLLSSPILINGKIIGVINVNAPQMKRPFNLDDLSLLDIVALFIGKSIQVIQLQSVLKSRFAQLALIDETQKRVGDALAITAQNPDKLAKIVAKSFYREMAKAGFGSAQIISAASEIISELSRNLQKHSKRMTRQ
ncbi:MAG: GAF domain-containing protein [Thiobacillus sp.]